MAVFKMLFEHLSSNEMNQIYTSYIRTPTFTIRHIFTPLSGKSTCFPLVLTVKLQKRVMFSPWNSVSKQTRVNKLDPSCCIFLWDLVIQSTICESIVYKKKCKGLQ